MVTTAIKIKIKVTRCPDCNGSKVYVGLGFFPAEPCRACRGTGVEATWSPEAPAEQRREPMADPWALPEGVAWVVTTHGEWALRTIAGPPIGSRADFWHLIDLLGRRQKDDPAPAPEPTPFAQVVRVPPMPTPAPLPRPMGWPAGLPWPGDP